MPSSKYYSAHFGGVRKALLKSGVSEEELKKKDKKITVASDGTLCLSYYEKLFVDYFITNNILYEKEVPYKKYTANKDIRYKFDFKVGDLFIELFGIQGIESYDKNAKKKKKFIKETK